MASFNAGVSGLQSAQASLNTTAHNLANAHTPGYVRQQVLITDSFYQNNMGQHNNLMQVGTGTVIVRTRQIRNTFLDARYRLEFGRQGFYEVNQNTAREIEDMLGELEGESFLNSITDLQRSLKSLAEDPSEIVYKDEMVSMATLFIQRAQEVRKELNLYQTSLNSEVLRQVNAINDLVSKIREMNKQIQRYEIMGESANDYRDKRNQYLDELGYYIDFETNEEKDGTITIYSQGQFLLEPSRQNFLSVEYESPTSRLLKPTWEGGGDYFRNKSLAYSSKAGTDIGTLRGLMVARGNYAANYTDTPVKPNEEDYASSRDYEIAMSHYEEEVKKYNEGVGASVVMSVQSQLDMLVHGIVTMINDAFCKDKTLTLADGTTLRVLDEDNAWQGDDINSTMGTEVFSRRGYERYKEVTLADNDGNPLKDSEGNDLVGADGKPLTVKVYQEEDPADPGTLYSIVNLEVNPALLKDSSRLPVMYNDKTGAKDGYVIELKEVVDSFENDIGTLNPNSLTTYNSLDFYQGMVEELSVRGSVWNGVVSNQETTVTSIDTERQNVMGVSSEEELSDLIKFQRCYDASSRYITTVAEMLEYLIERLG
jgi:flagellar hook-associated protein FlgK